MIEKDHSPWWASKIRLSGASAHTSEQFRGRVEVDASGLTFSGHSMGVEFRNDTARKTDNQLDYLSLRYGFPFEGSQIRVNVSQRTYRNATTSGGERVSESGRKRSMSLMITRPLFSFHAIEFDSTLRHFSRETDEYQAGAWQSNDLDRRSSVSLKASSRGELDSGFVLHTRMDARIGTEHLSTRESSSINESDLSYQKLAVSSSLSRTLINWRVALDGHYQFSRDPLPDSEHVTVASSSLLRGFSDNSLSSSEGGWLKINAQSPAFEIPFTGTMKTHIRLATLRGWVADSSPQADDSARASAYEASLLMRGGEFNAALTVGRMFESAGHAFEVPNSPDVSFAMQLQL
ncbi:hypothetical protein FWJ25_06575 [Marinobacter salinexigens]|uniref:Haemolysin activator HlyB C-terminal domain-containing protein n=1 Tax=Marinobacter salinexigens TaxID=2919747 RepID=A0A5B0VLX5_9GAMM|nr:ShlB/FhaC/HecB family hemolysin secretion/activation protein [Marinobacter salinexigens]KAA1175031.1 hypothetical protein FWJ25_06575 [Marinobacter salinexigens]